MFLEKAQGWGHHTVTVVDSGALPSATFSRPYKSKNIHDHNRRDGYRIIKKIGYKCVLRGLRGGQV